MKPFHFLVLVALLVGCSKSDEPGIRQITISISQTLVEVGAPSITIAAEVIDEARNVVENPNLEFLANNTPLNGNSFNPDTRGTFIIQARIGEVVSNEVSVRVFDLAQDLDQLILNYGGSNYLTTTDWSLSGEFTFEARIDNVILPLTSPAVELRLNDTSTNQRGGFQFAEAGTATFQAFLNDKSSNPIEIEVRAEKEYDEIVLPIIFHTYQVDIGVDEVNMLLDTLNNGFSPSSFPKSSVLAGKTSPNAVNTYVKFEVAQRSPDGLLLSVPGLNVIEGPIEDPQPLTEELFSVLDKAHSWDPNEYINVWIVFNTAFAFPPIDTRLETSAPTGVTYSPFIEEGFSLPGLATAGANPRYPDPADLSQSIIFNATTLFPFHRDFIVNKMGYFLGLLETFAHSCDLEGDYCEDTLIPKLTMQLDPLTGKFQSCEGPSFLPSNHMSIGGIYTHFTYDQRERIRFVLDHGLFRPGK